MHLIRGGTIPIPKNCDSGSLAHFGGIGTRIRVKGIVKGIEKESLSDSRFLISPTGRRNRDSRFLILRNHATSTPNLIVATVQIASLGEGDEDQRGRGELADERAEERDGERPVGDGAGEVGDDEEQLVRRVTALRPLVELHAGLEQGREGEGDAVDLDQAPVPGGGLFCKISY